jgi:hypothetical protein
MLNLEICITSEQTFPQVAVELERLGYKAWCITNYPVTRMVTAWSDGTYTNFNEVDLNPYFKCVTLQELKEMSNEL